MIALAATDDGVFRVDVDDEVVLDAGGAAVAPPVRVELTLPLVVASDAAGSTVIAVVARRPPLLVSNDAGVTWRETGGGLPSGRAVALDPDDPDRVLYAARNRLYVSTDGGRFWRALAVELPEIQAVGWE